MNTNFLPTGEPFEGYPRSKIKFYVEPILIIYGGHYIAFLSKNIFKAFNPFYGFACSFLNSYVYMWAFDEFCCTKVIILVNLNTLELIFFHYYVDKGR